MTYNWLVLAVLLMIVVRLKRTKPVRPCADDLPRVSVAVAAWKEELCIADKIRN